MAATIEVKFFNSFWIKKVVPQAAAPTIDTDTSTGSFDSANVSGYWPGLPWNPKGINGAGYTVIYPPFPWYNAPSYDYSTPNVKEAITLRSYNSTNYVFPAHWYLEESSHKGGFNNNRCSLGVRAYTILENPEGIVRSQSLIHSGVLNTRTGYNETNVFSVAENIEKDMDAINGSIQKLYTEDTNLTVLQEAKVNKLLINKNVLYSGTQGSAETGVISFFGQASAYAGEYGISKNPESFAIYGYRKYFTDRDRGVVCRLSIDGITEISDYGMTDYFRDNLANISNNLKSSINTTSTTWANSASSSSYYKLTIPDFTCYNSIPIGSQIEFGEATGLYQRHLKFITNIEFDSGTNVATITLSSSFIGNTLSPEVPILITKYSKDRIPGGWDIYNKNYTLSLQYLPTTIYDASTCSTTEGVYNTLNFDETVKGWVSFYAYKPLFLDSIKNYFYTFKKSNIYQHYVGDPTVANNYGKFYGATTPATSSIEFIFNPNPNVSKNFKTISYEGSNGWEMESAYSDYQEFDRTNPNVLSPSSSFIYGQNYRDSALKVNSVDEGIYIDSFGYPANAGFTIKENRYVADLISDNVNPRPSEVIYPLAVYPNLTTAQQSASDGMLTGIKGYVANVKLKLDTTTQPGGRKELFTVASNFVVSST